MQPFLDRELECMLRSTPLAVVRFFAAVSLMYVGHRTKSKPDNLVDPMILCKRRQQILQVRTGLTIFPLLHACFEMLRYNLGLEGRVWREHLLCLYVNEMCPLVDAQGAVDLFVYVSAPSEVAEH